mgnify:CR=1 FL=1
MRHVEVESVKLNLNTVLYVGSGAVSVRSISFSKAAFCCCTPFGSMIQQGAVVHPRHDGLWEAKNYSPPPLTSVDALQVASVGRCQAA